MQMGVVEASFTKFVKMVFPPPPYSHLFLVAIYTAGASNTMLSFQA
jgi:hypothetical protein